VVVGVAVDVCVGQSEIILQGVLLGTDAGQQVAVDIGQIVCDGNKLPVEVGVDD